MSAPEPAEAVVLREQDMEEPLVRPFVAGQAVLFSRRAPGKEGPNQDCAALLPYDKESGVLMIADGAGGQRGGARHSGREQEPATGQRVHHCRPR